MGASIGSLLVLSLLFVAVLITWRVDLFAGELMGDAMRGANAEQRQRSNTAVSITDITASNAFRCDTNARVTLENTGDVAIGDFDKMDIFTWYTPQTGDPFTKRFDYTTGNLAKGEWTLRSLSPDNNLWWEPGESAVLNWRFLLPQKEGTSGYVTVSTPNGISDSDYVTFNNVVSSECFFLHNNPTPPTGDTASQSVLPMDGELPSAVPQLPTLFNFDTNRDGSPGLLLEKTSDGLGETSDNQFQVWRSAVFTSPLTISGDVLVDIWAKLQVPTLGQIGVVLVYLRDYDANGGAGYIEIADGAVYARDWQSNSTTFVERSGLIQGVGYTVPVGHQLELRLIIDNPSSDDMELAYDIASFPSLLNLSFVPPVATTPFYLHNNPTPPTEDTPPQAVLPLDSTAPTAAFLYNYDLPGSKPGLELQTSPLGLAEPTEYQAWRTSILASPLEINGDVFIDLWAALRQFQPDFAGAINMYLRDYDGVGYTEIANSGVYAEDWQEGSGTFIKRTIMMSDVSYTVPAGNQLEARLVVDSIKASKDMWFAYDTTAYPSVINLP